MRTRIGAPGSIARYVQESMERGVIFGGRWLVFEYAPGPVVRAVQTSRAEAQKYMAPGRVLVDVESYRQTEIKA